MADLPDLDTLEDVKDDDARQSASSKKKAKKQEKKMGKKQAQYRGVLSELGVEFSTECTPFLFVANGGLDNGVDRESLVDMLSRHGVLQRVVMQKHKSYALVEFAASIQAEEACVKLNGVVMDIATLSSRSPLYLLPMTSFPRHCECMADGGAEFSAPLPDGLFLVKEFVSEDEEKKLVDFFGQDGTGSTEYSTGSATAAASTGSCPDAALSASGTRVSASDAPASDSVCGALKHRRVQHYGYEFRYGLNDVDPTKPLLNHAGSLSGLPALLDDALQRMVAMPSLASPGKSLIPSLPDQLTVNDYQPGQGIPPHVDTSWAFEDAIVSLSLLSTVVMDFRHADGRHVPVWLPRRSLLVMTGESRYSWSHGITPRKVDCIPASLLASDESASATSASSPLTLVQRSRRISLTFRRIIKNPQRPVDSECTTSTQPTGSSPAAPRFVPPTTEQEAVEMEKKHVYEVYDNIASHFSSTRHTPWPRVVRFLAGLAPGSFVLDVGCGNGKYMNVNRESVSIGCDRSIGLTKIAKERDLNVAVADILQLPFRGEFFDACICIAVIHHLVTRERRLNALRELLRVTRPGGRVLVYVWAKEQEKCASRGRKKNATATATGGAEAGEATADAKRVEAQRGDFDQQDVLVPWKFAEPGKKKQKEKSKKPRSHGASESSVGQSSEQTAESASGDVPSATAHSDQQAESGSSAPLAQAGEVYQRFYHVFVRSELEEMCAEVVDEADLLEYYHDKGNWCAILCKRPT